MLLPVVSPLKMRWHVCFLFFFLLSVLSSGSREILSSSQSGVEQRETEHRLGQTDGR